MSKTPETLSHDVTAPLQATKKTAPFQIFVAAVACPLLLPIFCNFMVNAHAYTLTDAETIKRLFFDNIGQVVTFAIAGVVGGSVLVRGGKVAAQLAPGMATDATPNGEGIGGNATANEVPTVTESATVGMEGDDNHVDGVQDDGETPDDDGTHSE